MEDTKDKQKANGCQSSVARGYASPGLRDHYVAYCRYQGDGDPRTINTCNSDDDGAFKVYRGSELDKAYTEGQICQAILELQARDRFVASLKKEA